MTSPATAPKLLVVSDFDGTLAGFSVDAADVPVHARSLAALTRLAGLPDTHVAVLSGRHLEGLMGVCHLRAPITFAGSHGNESSVAGLPTAAEQNALDFVDAQLTKLIDEPGAFVERKPFQRVAHVFRLAQDNPARAEELLAAAALIDPGQTHMTAGKHILEFSATDVTKGTWIEGERERVGADVTVFLGDDVTDENGFRVLRGSDVGVKVGEGETLAGTRVADIGEVGYWLTQLADARAHHLRFPKETRERFNWVTAGFSAIVVQVIDWDAPTPCGGWSARDLVGHLAAWFPEAIGAPAIPGEPFDQWFGLVELARAQLEKHEELVRGMLLTDIFIHTWDLATSQGLDAHLDEGFAASLLRAFEAMDLSADGKFAAPVTVPEDAPVVERLLARTGRRP